MRLRISHHRIIVIALLLTVSGVVWLLVRAKPATEDDIRRSACYVEGTSSLCLVAGGDTVVLTADTLSQEGVWVNRHWWWPSCNGRVLTVLTAHTPLLHGLALRGAYLANDDSLRRYAAIGTDSLARLLDRKEIEGKELQYYLRSHGVIDEGYTQIAAYAAGQATETATLRQRVSALRAMLHADSARWVSPGNAAAGNNAVKADNNARKDRKAARSKAPKMRLIRRIDCRVSWYDSSDSLTTVGCRPLTVKPTGKAVTVIIHTLRSTKPWGTYAVRNVPWGAPRHRKIITVTLNRSATPADTTMKTGATVILATGRFDRGRGHDLPRLFAADGAPVFTLHGRFIGIVAGKEVMP